MPFLSIYPFATPKELVPQGPLLPVFVPAPLPVHYTAPSFSSEFMAGAAFAGAMATTAYAVYHSPLGGIMAATAGVASSYFLNRDGPSPLPVLLASVTSVAAGAAYPDTQLISEIALLGSSFVALSNDVYTANHSTNIATPLQAKIWHASSLIDWNLILFSCGQLVATGITYLKA